MLRSTFAPLVALLLFIVAVAPSASAAPTAEALCANPRSAADSLFIYQRADSYDLEAASACLDVPPSMQGERVAVQLRQVLDSNGIFVPVSQLPDEGDYATEEGNHTVQPVPDKLPELVLVRGDDGLWRYSRDTVEAVPRLYASTFSSVSVWFQNQLPAVFYTRALGLFLWQYLYAGMLLFVAFAMGTLARLLLKGQVRRMVGRIGLKLDDQMYQKTNGPMVTLVMLGVVYWGLSDLQLPIALSNPLHRLVWAVLWLAGLFLLSRFVNLGAGIAKDWAADTDSKLDDQLIPLLRQAAQIVLMVVGGLYVADAIGLDVWKLAAGVGIGGLAFALAAQDTVANVFGSVNIFIDRPFQIGDWVVVGDVEGVVEEVGFRSTRVRTFYNSVVTIPNSQITNANVDNMGLRHRRRIKLTIGLTYDTPPDKVQAYVEGVRAILACHPMVERTYEVHLYDLGASAIEILVYYHVKVPDFHKELVTRSQNILEFMRLAQELGVSFAFPSQSLYLESTPDSPLPDHSTPSMEELQRIANAFGPKGDKARPSGPRFGTSWSVQARDQRSSKEGSVHDGER